MNLSDIRKKAQQEKAAANGEYVANPGIGETGIAEAATPAIAVSEVEARLEGEGIPPRPAIRAEASPSPVFDPLAVILAGRAAMCGTEGTQAAPLSSEYTGEDFKELLCFKVAGEKYAVDIMEIKEIIKPREVTEVPRMPAYVSGVLSLRGVIIPVFNMHSRLGHESPQGSGRERIVVVKKEEEYFGVMVDEVVQVVRISCEGIEPPPAVLEGIDRDFVSGIGRYEGQMLILLHLDKVLDVSLY